VSPLEVAGLAAAGALAGLVSTVASVASVVSYPVLLAIGLPPLAANVTNTVALLFAGAGAAAGSRPELAGQRARLRRLGPACVAGGAVGAAVLLLTPASWFGYAAPVLIAAGSVILLIPRPAARTPDPAAKAQAAKAPAAEAPAAGEAVPGWALGAAVAAVACYIGYFGAAGGILMLALLAATQAGPLPRANAAKNVLNGLANAAAAVVFTWFGPVDWAVVPPLAAGFLAGGAVGPAVVRRMPATVLRAGVAAAGLVIAIKLGAAAYGHAAAPSR
jgi:uncharacterized membrane protein YfcA